MSKFNTLFICVLALSGCGSSVPIGPQEAVITEAVQQQIQLVISQNGANGIAEVRNLNVIAVENVGDSVRERVDGRFEARVRFSVALYAERETITETSLTDAPIQLVDVSTEIGDWVALTGIYNAALSSRTSSERIWDIEIAFDGSAISQLGGIPLEGFPNPLLGDSEAGRRLVSSFQRLEEERQRERLVAEERRLRVIEHLPGRWRTTDMFRDSENGDGFSQLSAALPPFRYVCSGPPGFGMELNIPNFEGTTSPVTGAIFWQHDPAIRDEFTGSISMNDDFSEIALQFNRDVGFRNTALVCRGARAKLTYLFPSTNREYVFTFSGSVEAQDNAEGYKIDFRWTHSSDEYRGILQRRE